MHAFTLPVATPEYLKIYGTPRKPEDLFRHIGLLKSGPGFLPTNRLVRRGEIRTVMWKSIHRYVDMLNIKDAMMKSMGIAVDLPLGVVLEEIRNGEVVQVLDNWHRDFWDYSVVIRSEDTKTDIGRFATWYARRATADIDWRREEGFRLLGVDPRLI